MTWPTKAVSSSASRVASTAASRCPSKSGWPGMFLISMSTRDPAGEEQEHLLEGRHHPERPDLLQRHLSHEAVALGGPVDVGIVQHDGDVVGRHPDVELDHVRPGGDGALEGREGVLGFLRGGATVGHDQRNLGLTESSFRHYCRPDVARSGLSTLR